MKVMAPKGKNSEKGKEKEISKNSMELDLLILKQNQRLIKLLRLTKVLLWKKD